MAVTYELDDGVAIVTLDRPEVRNAVDVEAAAELADAFRRFERDEEASVAVLYGAGGTFCAGYDLRSLTRGEQPRLQASGDAPMGPSRLRLTKPVIAAVEGFAVAGGMELALWCDLRIAAEDAVFGIFNRRFGVPLVDLGTIRLPRLIGQSRALDLVLTGRPVTAPEAFQMGLVNRIAAPGQARAAAVSLGAELARFPQAAMRHDRLSLLEQWELTDSEAIANELEHGLATIASGEPLAGAQEFSRGAGRKGSFA